MQKVIIFGNSGSGKSTLAKRFATKGAAHFDLDSIAWLTSDPPTRRPLDEASQTLRTFVGEHQSWVVEGCYADLLAQVIPEANEMIFLNLSVADYRKRQDETVGAPQISVPG